MLPHNSVPRLTIDTHAHVFTRAILTGTSMEGAFDQDFGYDRYIDALERANLSYGVIAAATFLGAQHDYTLAALAAHERLRATVIVEPEISIAELSRLDDAGVVGIQIGTGNMDRIPDLGSSAYSRMFGLIHELGWHVHIYGKPTHIPELLKSLAQTKLPVIVDHFGLRGEDPRANDGAFEAVLTAFETGRTWVKLSGDYLSGKSDHASLAARLLDLGGATRLLWGSDWPFVQLNGRHSIEATKYAFASWIPDPDLQAQIDRNALSLYGFAKAELS